MIDLEKYIQEADRNLQRSRYYGAYYGIVEDNDDPEELGRLKIRIPQIHSTVEVTTDALPWALNGYSKGGGSPDRGEYNVPDVGSQVLVIHIMADPDYPVCIATVWGSGDTIEEVHGRSADTSGPHGNVFPGSGPIPEKVKCIKTSTGHKMIFDDNPENPDIILETSEGHLVVLDDKTDRRKIEIQTVTGHNIILDDTSGSEKIELRTQQGHDILIDDANNKIKAETVYGHTIDMDDPTKTITVNTKSGPLGSPQKIIMTDGGVLSGIQLIDSGGAFVSLYDAYAEGPSIYAQTKSALCKVKLTDNQAGYTEALVQSTGGGTAAQINIISSGNVNIQGSSGTVSISSATALELTSELSVLVSAPFFQFTQLIP